jgi:hypothetical protein
MRSMFSKYEKIKSRNKLKVLKTLSPQTILSMALNKIPLWLFDFVLIDGFLVLKGLKVYILKKV